MTTPVPRDPYGWFNPRRNLIEMVFGAAVLFMNYIFDWVRVDWRSMLILFPIYYAANCAYMHWRHNLRYRV